MAGDPSLYTMSINPTRARSAQLHHPHITSIKIINIIDTVHRKKQGNSAAVHIHGWARPCWRSITFTTIADLAW